MGPGAYSRSVAMHPASDYYCEHIKLKEFGQRQKILNFTMMATLTRYSTLRSLKQSPAAKAKRTANASPLQITEVKTFLLLLQKKNLKKVKITKN